MRMGEKMIQKLLLAAFSVAILLSGARGSEFLISDDAPLQMPLPGAHALRVLSPSVLEITLITTKGPDPTRVTEWNFIGADGHAHLPKVDEFSVSLEGKPDTVKAVGFKRRVLYAPLKKRDLRIGNYLYLRLETAIADGQSVTVLNPDQKLWAPDKHFTARAALLRWSPAIHVNQVG